MTRVTVRFAGNALPEHASCPFFSPLAVVVDYDDDNYSDALFILFFFWIGGDPLLRGRGAGAFWSPLPR